MADTTQGDTEGQYLALLAPALIALIPGLLIHSFIIGVNVTDWWKGRSVTPVDLIVTSLGVSRMCTQCANGLYLFVTTVFLSSVYSQLSLDIGTLYVFFTYSNFWLTSLLSIVFCLKISNLHTRLFLYLRGVIEHRTGYLIVASVLLSTINCLMIITELVRGGKYNTTMKNISMDYINVNFIYSYSVGAFIPLLFYYISSVLLFASLYHHTTQMKMSSNLSINLETYYSVMKFVSVTFIYNTTYFFGNFVCIFHYFFYSVDILWLVIILGFLPVLHSSYVIYITAKLRSQVSKVLQNMIDFLSQWKLTEIREDR